MIGRILSRGLVLAVGILVVVACGSDAGDDGSSSGGASSGASSGNFGGSSGSSGTTTDDLAGCANQTIKGEALPLDIYIMMDVSYSMTEKTGTGATKFASVKDALKGFINDPSSAGVGVGLQVFPIQHAGVPLTCTASSQCGADGGKCVGYQACHPANQNDPIKWCDTDNDCGNGGQAKCRVLGQCPLTNPPGGLCLVGDPQYGCNGVCQGFPSGSCDNAECHAEDYTPPLVAISALPGNAGTLTSSIDGIPTPPQGNNTPTSLAIKSALAVAQPYATANPGHAVVVVLATDGIPTTCDPTDIPTIAGLANAGVTGSPSVKTFVIGVFADAEKTTAQKNLDAIAAGGGTTKALIVSTGGNVAADFKAALDQIRGAALPCDYKVPQPTSGTPDYDKVNVAFTPMTGAKELVIPKTSGQGACDANGGWYYDVDPAAGSPTKIILCPSSCTAVKSASGTGSKVDVLLGCKTIVK